MVTKGGSEGNIYNFVGIPFVRFGVGGFVKGQFRGRVNKGVGADFLRARSHQGFRLKKNGDSSYLNGQLFLRINSIFNERYIIFSYGETRHTGLLYNCSRVFLRGTISFNRCQGSVFVGLCAGRCGRRAR